MGVGFFAVLPMASPASSLSRPALRARDALALKHMPLADAIASATADRFFPLVERDDLLQVAREALVLPLPAAEPLMQHQLRDLVRLVRISRCEHEKGTFPLGHASLDAPAAGEHSLLDQLEAPAAELASGSGAEGLALEQPHRYAFAEAKQI